MPISTIYTTYCMVTLAPVNVVVVVAVAVGGNKLVLVLRMFVRRDGEEEGRGMLVLKLLNSKVLRLFQNVSMYKWKI